MSIMIKRIIAYFLDVVIVTLLSSVLSMTPLNPYYEKKIEIDYQEKIDKIQEQISDFASEDSSSEDLEIYMKKITRELEGTIQNVSRLSIFEYIIVFVVSILYFVVLPKFWGGATLGKKITKLRVVNKDGTAASVLGLFIRSMILYGLPFNLLSSLVAYTMSGKYFFAIYSALGVISYILSIVVFVTTLGKKDNRGLHDMLAKTRVEGIEVE